jgi:hypothetical protein
MVPAKKKNSTAAVMAPVHLLLAAAKDTGIKIYLGMASPSNEAWGHMGFANFSGNATATMYYKAYCSLQQKVATELWSLYGVEYGTNTIAGFYLNLEVGNQLSWMHQQELITHQHGVPSSPSPSNQQLIAHQYVEVNACCDKQHTNTSEQTFSTGC